MMEKFCEAQEIIAARKPKLASVRNFRWKYGHALYTEGRVCDTVRGLFNAPLSSEEVIYLDRQKRV